MSVGRYYSTRGRKSLAPELECNLHPQKDRDVKFVINRCDICNDHLIKAPDDIEAQIDKFVEVNNSSESEYDKQEPRLLLCDYCNKQYMIPCYRFR